MSYDIEKRRDSIGTLELYTHGFKVIARDDRVATATRITLKDWAVYTEEMVERVDGSKVKQLVISQTYGAALPGNKEFWLHKGQFQAWQTDLLRYSLTPDDFHIVRKELYVPQPFDIKMKPNRNPYPFQVEAGKFAMDTVTGDDHDTKLISIPPGKGKACANGTPVKTPDGWTPIEELKEGDLVMTVTGEYTKVTGVYPQGSLPMYRAIFEDGRESTVCMDHLWEVEKPSGLTNVCRTSDLLEYMLQDLTVSIPLVEFKSSPIWEKVRDIILDKGVPQLYEGHIVSPEHFEEVPDVVDIVREHGGKISLETNGYRISHISLFETEYNQRLKLVDIEKTDDSEATCISVEHDSKLFVIGDYVVTHNTITLCYTSTLLKQRTVIAILKKYAGKWPKDLLANLDCEAKDIMVIEKTSQLRGVIDLCKTQGAKKLPAFIIVTHSTMRSFIDSFELNPQDCIDDYGCEPCELWGLLKCGLFGIDEAHEHLNTVFKIAMYLHGPKFVALSGTMLSEDPEEARRQQMIFPNARRFEGIESGKYTDLELISYNFGPESKRKIKCTAFGRNDYSHAVFEQSILKHPAILRDYIEMNCSLVDYGYLRLFQKGDKMIMFVGIVEMAEVFYKYMTARYRDKIVVRYCKSDGDKYDDMMNGDIIITTVQSGGTGIDVEGLTYLNNTVLVNSAKSNIQLFYRVREVKGRSTSATMPFNTQNPKHVKYTEYRREIFASRTKTIRTFNYNKHIGP